MITKYTKYAEWETNAAKSAAATQKNRKYIWIECVTLWKVYIISCVHKSYSNLLDCCFFFAECFIFYRLMCVCVRALARTSYIYAEFVVVFVYTFYRNKWPTPRIRRRMAGDDVDRWWNGARQKKSVMSLFLVCWNSMKSHLKKTRFLHLKIKRKKMWIAHRLDRGAWLPALKCMCNII